jgi:microcystin-dependent protein
LLTVAGGVPTWAAAPQTGITIADDTTTNATRYITFTDATTGNELGLDVSSTKLQYNPSTGVVTATGFSGALNGTVGATTPTTATFTDVTLNGQGDLRFADSDSSNWVAFQAPATVASNVTWTLPDADGTTGQVLSTDGSGVLSWASGGGGGGPPAGSVIWFAANSAPTGYLKANGANVSRTTYSDLFTAIGTTFGAGDGSTTFGLPDLRGEFIRGWDDGRGVDSGRAFGSAQLDQMQTITGTLDNTGRAANGMAGSFAAPSNAGALSYGGPNRLNSAGASGSTQFSSQINFDSASSPSARTGTETRSRNIALLACIKF